MYIVSKSGGKKRSAHTPTTRTVSNRQQNIIIIYSERYYYNVLLLLLNYIRRARTRHDVFWCRVSLLKYYDVYIIFYAFRANIRWYTAVRETWLFIARVVCTKSLTCRRVVIINVLLIFVIFAAAATAPLGVAIITLLASSTQVECV